MATKTELWDQIAKAVAIIDHAYKAGATDATNLLGLIDNLQTSYEGDHIQSTENGVTSLRSSWSGLIASSTAVLSSLILELARVGYSSTSTSVTSALDDIAKGMNDASETIKSRAFTFANAVAAVSNVGNGQVFRVLQSQYGNPLEVPFGGNVKWRCTQDVNTSRTAGNENGLLSGDGETKVDELNVGDVTSSTLALAVNNSNLITSQAGFNVADIGSLTDWTINSGTQVIDSVNFHRETGSDDGSLQFSGNGKVSRQISINLNQARPSIFVIAYNREVGSGDGTIRLSLGNQDQDLVLASETGWNFHAIGVDLSNKGWYEVFKEVGNTVEIGIELLGNTTGTVLVDDAWLVQPVLFDGAYYLAVPGKVDFQVGDEITFADTVANTGRIQYWLSRLFSKSLPSTTGVPTYPDA